MMDFFHANFMLQTPNESDNQPPSSLPSLLPSCSPHDFHVMNAPMLGKRSMSFSGIDAFNEETNGGCGGGGGGEEDNLSDDGSQGGGGGEKKIRRLNTEQVKTLEKNFQLGNKLEPDRKVQLAKALGLQPRQVAIWFQNRRARWKTKQLEKEYEILKSQFEALKADNESLLSKNQKLQSEISALKGREPTESINLNKETDQGSCSNRSENSSDIKLDMSTTAAAGNGIDSPLSAHPPSSRSFFPPSASSTFNRPNGHGHGGAPTMTQFFQNPPIARPDLHCQRFDQGVKEESYTNMFCGIDDHSGFWPWIEQPNFN